ncbi:MAG: apolipoprotein N-acyltransferase [Treponema sp.]|jgi:apolipoprotein N-acyltransferase|nr:apolipoprotein N-acyltransferase [Treponema sp.]
MSLPHGKEYIKSFFLNFAAIVLAAVLFAASFPNPVFKNGLPVLAWIAYIPVFWVIRRSGFLACVFWGALYGYGAYSLFNYWLSVFHPLAGLIVNSIYLVYFAVFFPMLKLALVLYPKRGYILQWLLWMGFDFLRIQGFLGYAYGISGYSQWNILPLIQIASVAGVWGVSALVIFPSAWLAAALPDDGLPWAGFKPHLYAFFQREKLSASIWLASLAGVLIFGFVTLKDYSGPEYKKAKLALVQLNTDPWKGDINQYRENFRILKNLSDEAIAASPGLDLVVWSETAFVPRIHWHQRIRDDHGYWLLVKELLDYLALQNVPFVIGNDDARREPAKNPDITENHRVDYNAVMLFEGGEIKQLYRKMHLVPFTEHFPYQRQFPLIYKALSEADTHFWEKGKEAVVFDSRGIKFSTPICFEDIFGDISREFTRNGALLIVNLSNDAWSRSLPAQMQHLSMAVFRSVENRRSMARSTASGQTCAIDPNGKIIDMAEAFTETFLTVEVPLVTESSLYTAWGDWLPILLLFLAGLLLIAGISSAIIKKARRAGG